MSTATRGPRPGGAPPAPSVWTAATNPWFEQAAGGAAEQRPDAPPPNAWRRLLSWLIEYNRY